MHLPPLPFKNVSINFETHALRLENVQRLQFLPHRVIIRRTSLTLLCGWLGNQIGKKIPRLFRRGDAATICGCQRLGTAGLRVSNEGYWGCSVGRELHSSIWLTDIVRWKVDSEKFTSMYVDDWYKILEVIIYEVSSIPLREINLPKGGRINYHAQNILQKSELAECASSGENDHRNQSTSRRRIFGQVPHLSRRWSTSAAGYCCFQPNAPTSLASCCIIALFFTTISA
jgi:hypothetical protein